MAGVPPNLFPPLALAGVGATVTLISLVYTARGLRTLRGTETTEGRVLDARLEIRKAPDQVSKRVVENHMPVVEYEYEVDGRRYESDDIWPFDVVGFGVGRRAATAVERYDEDDAVTVNYDPADPTDAYLEVGGGAASVARHALVGLLALVGAVVWAYLVA